MIYGRSDSTLNRGGVRMGTSEFYRVVESLPEILGSLVIDTTGLGRSGQETPGRLLLFVVLRAAVVFDDVLADRIRERIKTELSPRYLPDGIFNVPEIPQTLNGKKLEVPVKRIFQGIELSKSVSREAMSNPDSLKPFLELAEQFGTMSDKRPRMLTKAAKDVGGPFLARHLRSFGAKSLCFLTPWVSILIYGPCSPSATHLCLERRIRRFTLRNEIL